MNLKIFTDNIEEQAGLINKVMNDSVITDNDGYEYTDIEIFKDYLLAYDGRVDRNGILEPTTFYWKDYGNKWWLKEVL